MVRQHRLTFPGRYKEIQRICRFVGDGAREAGMDEDAVFHLELCCDEAATNIIEHSYEGEGKGDIDVTYEIGEETFKITLHDTGKPFDPNAVPKPNSVDLGETDNDPLGGIMKSLQVGGLGIHFMRKLMDKVQYRFDDTEGNTLILVKNFKGADL